MIIILGLILAFILILIFANHRTRHCRWREIRRGAGNGQQKFKCVICGAETFTKTGKPPLVCLNGSSEK